jgi:predicted RNA-binding protein
LVLFFKYIRGFRLELAIISNICANFHALQAFLDHINEEHQVALIINTGNFLQIGPNPFQVCKKVLTNRFLNILSKEDIMVLDRIPWIESMPKYFTYYDWALSQIGLGIADKLKKLPLEYVLEYEGTKMLIKHSFPQDLSSKPNYIVIGEPRTGFISEFQGIKVIASGILGFSKEGVGTFVVLDLSNNRIEMHTIKYNKAKLFTEYRKSRIPEKKEILRTYHGVPIVKTDGTMD